ncbi:probable 28S ribosomal protein S23, mitochondrial [Cephus cinctus]|uniref:Small ribosomal subunit protein mS23 n=1 Tax=Cephus cinctus TaxID=211228 RepID=A0AAJ7FVF1_CEPCN|nr:probable 28S ribosomal protein S23, mitochondrial [Cephus cinctus]
MAQSRLERIGTVYSRISSLLKGGALKDIDKPVWYTVYEAFPPKYEPRFDREAPKTKYFDIFYKEDYLRMEFQERNKNLSTNLMDTRRKSRTQEFISIYHDMKKNGVHQDVCFQKSLDKLLEQRPTSTNRSQDTSSKSSITSSFSQEKNEKININIKDILNN